MRFTDEELVHLNGSVDGLGDMFYSSGASKPPLDVPEDASPQAKVLARMGRAG